MCRPLYASASALLSATAVLCVTARCTLASDVRLIMTADACPTDWPELLRIRNENRNYFTGGSSREW